MSTREKPIILNSDMVRATLAGRKTQTRRICKLHPALLKRAVKDASPFWKADKLWVKETWAKVYDEFPFDDVTPYHVEYKADSGARYPGGWPDDFGDDPDCCKWRASIHMPRWASRIKLEIINVRVERVQDITESDAVKEGLLIDNIARYQRENNCSYFKIYRTAFKKLWNSIYGRDAWARNDWVCVIEFKKI